MAPLFAYLSKISLFFPFLYSPHLDSHQIWLILWTSAQICLCNFFFFNFHHRYFGSGHCRLFFFLALITVQILNWSPNLWFYSLLICFSCSSQNANTIMLFLCLKPCNGFPPSLGYESTSLTWPSRNSMAWSQLTSQASFLSIPSSTLTTPSAPTSLYFLFPQPSTWFLSLFD